ncbi:hypothetical protein Ancab_003907 [Ancistrocladus abbreviatus]
MSKIIDMGEWRGGNWEWVMQWRRKVIDRGKHRIEALANLLIKCKLTSQKKDYWTYSLTKVGVFVVKAAYMLLRDENDKETISSAPSVAVDDYLFLIPVTEKPFSDGCISFTSNKIIHHSSRPSVSPSGILASFGKSWKLPPLTSASKELLGTSASGKGAGFLSHRECCLQHHSDSHDEPSVSSHMTSVRQGSDGFLEPSVSHIQETPLHCLQDHHLSSGPLDDIQSVKEAWDFLSQLELSSKGNDDEMIRRLEDMEAVASRKVPP